MDTTNDAKSIIEAARAQIEVKTLADGTQVAAVPQGFSIQTLTKHLPVASRIVANKSFHDGDSLARYVQRYKDADSLLIASITASKVVTLLDYHSAEAPAAVDHSATWQVRHSDEFTEWSKLNGRLTEQAEFIRFLEEHVSDIVSPDPASILELAKDFSAMKSVKFQSAKRLDNGDRNLQYVEETGTKSGIEIPQKLTLSMPIYYGEEPVQFQAWFRYRIADGGLTLGYEFHRIEPVKQAAFKAAVHRVAELAGLDPFYGDA